MSQYCVESFHWNNSSKYFGVCNGILDGSLLAASLPFQICPHILFMSEIRALWWPHQNIDFVVRKPLCSHFDCLLQVVVHLKDQFVPKPLGSRLMSLDIPCSWHHLFCDLHQFLLQQKRPKIWCYHLVEASCFLLQIVTVVVVAKQFHLSFTISHYFVLI